MSQEQDNRRPQSPFTRTVHPGAVLLSPKQSSDYLSPSRSFNNQSMLDNFLSADFSIQQPQPQTLMSSQNNNTLNNSSNSNTNTNTNTTNNNNITGDIIINGTSLLQSSLQNNFNNCSTSPSINNNINNKNTASNDDINNLFAQDLNNIVNWLQNLNNEQKFSFIDTLLNNIDIDSLNYTKFKINLLPHLNSLSNNNNYNQLDLNLPMDNKTDNVIVNNNTATKVSNNNKNFNKDYNKGSNFTSSGNYHPNYPNTVSSILNNYSNANSNNNNNNGNKETNSFSKDIASLIINDIKPINIYKSMSPEPIVNEYNDFNSIRPKSADPHINKRNNKNNANITSASQKIANTKISNLSNSNNKIKNNFKSSSSTQNSSRSRTPVNSHHNNNSNTELLENANNTSNNNNNNNNTMTPNNLTDFNLLLNIPMWLKTLRLHKYSESLGDINWEKLIYLDDQDLEKLGVTALGARRKLLKAFNIVKDCKENNLIDPRAFNH